MIAEQGVLISWLLKRKDSVISTLLQASHSCKLSSRCHVNQHFLLLPRRDCFLATLLLLDQLSLLLCLFVLLPRDVNDAADESLR